MSRNGPQAKALFHQSFGWILGERIGSVCSGSGRLGFGLERVFDDLAVEGASADIEDFGRLLLVPAHAFEDPDDVRALGLAQRWHPLARVDGRRLGGVEALAVGAAG